MLGLQEYVNEYAEKHYYMPPGPEREVGFWPLHAGRMIAKPNYHVGPKHSPFYTMYFIISGHLSLGFRGQQVILDERDVFCQFPNESVEFGLSPVNPNLQMSWIAFHGENTFPLMRYIGLSAERPYVRQAVGTHFPEKLKQLFLEFQRLPEGGNYLRFLGMLYDLFGQLAATAAENKGKSNHPTPWLKQSIDFMNMHYMEGITVQHVADYVNLHRSYFSTVFTEQCSITPTQYLQQLRMKSAGKMVAESDFTVTEIALSLGYPDLYTFTKAFRKYYGNSPSQYRKQYKTN